MTTPIELIGASMFLGVLSNAAWELVKRAWERLTLKPLEELYIEAFQASVDAARPRLTRHARDGQVELDQGALRKVLQMNLRGSAGGLSPSSVSRDSFLAQMANAMCERSVVVIGGHNLTHHEYLQLSYDLARHAAARFADVVSRDEAAFRQALLREAGRNRSVLDEIYSRMQSLEELEQRLDGIAAALETQVQPSASPQPALLGQRVQRVEAAVRHLVDIVMAQTGNGARAVIPTVRRSDKPPPAPKIHAPRLGRVADLATALRAVTWLALVDGAGKGKSQLARMIAEARTPSAVCWVALRGHRGVDSELHLESQMLRWLAELRGSDRPSDLGHLPHENLIHVAQLMSERTRGGGLLIVDDLPDPAGNEPIYEELCWIAAGLARHGAGMLTTSQRPLPPSVMIDMGSALRVATAGSFSSSDVLDMLESAGAPNDARTDAIATLILTSTGAHPSLIAATVAWLRRRAWVLDEDTLMGVLQGQPGEPVRQYHRRRMLRLVDEPARKLLYRLSLIEEGFDRRLAAATSAVSDGIEDSGLLLDDLRGPWVDDAGDDHLEVTPVLRGVGRDNLPAETQKEVHRAVADHYLSQGTVDASQAHWIAVHLWKAELYEQFSHFLIGLMLAADTPAEARYILWASSLISPGIEWPEELNLDQRVSFRAAQVRTRLLAGRDARALDADLEDLMSRTGPENSRSLIFACLNTGLLLPVEDLPAGMILPRAVRAVRLLRQEGMIREQDFTGTYEDIIWLAAFRLKGLAQARQFLAELSAMTSDELTLVFQSRLAAEMASHVLDSVWYEQAAKPEVDQDWTAVLSLLDEARGLAKRAVAPALVLACARARAVVLADYMGRSDSALKVLEELPQPADHSLSFLVNYTAGCILFDSNHTEEALRRLDAGSAVPGDGFTWYRFHAQFLAAIAAGRLALWDKARQRCGGVIRTAATMTDVLAYERLEMMGELAWVHWASGDTVKACAAMCGFVTGLAALNDPMDPRYREAFNKAGHALGWFATIASTGEPPAVTASGEAYAPVQAGFFGVRREQMAQFTAPVGFSRAWLLAQLGTLALAVGLRHLAKSAYELSQGLAEGRKTDEVLLVFVDARLASLNASLGHLDQALDLILKASNGLAIHGYGPHVDQILATPDDDLMHNQAPALSPEQARAAEHELVLGMVVGPALVGLLSSGWPPEKSIDTLVDLQTAVAERRNSFRESALGEKVKGFLNALINLWRAEAVPEEPPPDVDDSFHKALWFLVASSHRSTRLVDSLRMQVQAVDFLLRVPDARVHVLPGIGTFVHGFWMDIANTRSFALNHPRLFREELRGLSSQGGAKTAVGVLVSACAALGVRLPPEIRSRFAAA